MENSTGILETEMLTGLLEKGLEDAVQRAADNDLQGVRPELPDDWSADLPQTHEEFAQAILEYYRRNQTAVDTTLQGALAFLDTPRGAGYVQLFRNADENTDGTALAEQVASEMFQSSEFDEVRSSGVSEGQAFGLGISGGGSYYLGLLGGFEFIFDYQRDHQINTRGWVGLALESGKTINLGLEMSYWEYLPLNGIIFGWVVDMDASILTGRPYTSFIRFTGIFEREQASKKYVLAGISLQIPLGIGAGALELPVMLGFYGGYQWARSRGKRATLSVINQSTSTNNIVVHSPDNTLNVTLTNISAGPITLNSNATVKVNLPSFFSADDASAMSIDCSGWTFSADGTNLYLTLTKGKDWNTGPDNAIKFAITNVVSSSSLTNQEVRRGTITVTLDPNTTAKGTIITSNEFDLVPVSSSANLKWNVTLNPADFTLQSGSLSYGTATAEAQGGTNFIPLSTVVSTTDSTDIWDLGYVFNYNGLTGDPQICAAWLKQDAPQRGTNVAYGDFTSTSKTVDCYYAGLDSTGSSISIDVTFDQE